MADQTRKEVEEAIARVAKMENALRSMAGRKDLNQASCEWLRADADALKALIGVARLLLAEPAAWECIRCPEGLRPFRAAPGADKTLPMLCPVCGGPTRPLVRGLE